MLDQPREGIVPDEEGKALMRKWGLADTYEGIGICILGYVKGEIPAPKARKEDYIVMA